MPFSKLAFAASVAALHSFVAAESVLTPGPSPTQALSPRQVAGGPGTPILSTLEYAFSDLPEQVYPFAVLRGPQFGYNICNSTTEGPDSNCQTLIFNNASDFCLWGSPTADGSIGDVEAKVVAYCTSPGHGTRIIPPGSITGLQFIKTSAYVQVSGFIMNPGIGLDWADEGGELDPHGADLQGNPLGGVVYSNGTADATGGQETQVHNWNTFVGGNQFCFKACYNSITSPDYCENRYDLVGCDYNMPGQVQNGTFTVCDGDLQDVVGVYTTDGTTTTWSMPATLTTSPPYTPRIPASSNCQTFASTDLFAAVQTTSASGSSATQTGSGSGSSGSGSPSGSKSGSGSSASQTGSGSAAIAIQVPFTALGAVLGFVILGGAML